MPDIQEAIKQAKFALMQVERSPEYASGQLDAALQSLERCVGNEEGDYYALQFACNEMKNAAMAIHEPYRVQPLQYFLTQAMQACRALELEEKRKKERDETGEAQGKEKQGEGEKQEDKEKQQEEQGKEQQKKEE